MGNMSRREAVFAIAGIVVAGACRPPPPIPGPEPQDPFERWRALSGPWWKERLAERDRDRLTKVPRPYLTAPPVLSSRGPLADQLRAIGPQQDGEVSFWVYNEGNGASWTCFAEAYEGQWTPSQVDGHPISTYRLTGRRVITLQPGQRREVTVPWRLERLSYGSILVACYDPMLDPRSPTITEVRDRQSTGIHWIQWG